MSLHPQPIPAIPEETARLARAVLPEGNVLTQMRDELGTLYEDASLRRSFVQLPKLVLYAGNLSRDAKLLYTVLSGYAWQEQRCFSWLSAVVC